MCKDGRGVEQDYAKAVKYFRLAANQGHAECQLALGIIYAKGSGVTQNYAKAIKYFQPAADQGNVHALGYLGLIYGDGCGVAQNYAEAAKYYQLAADQGNSRALWHLGKLYGDGKGVPLDAEKAMRCFWESRQSANVINLAGLGLTDNMLQHLPSMFEEFGGYGQVKERTPIIELDLSNNPITDISAPSIAFILKHTKVLTKLFLEKTAITDYGMKPVFNALKNFNTSVVVCAFDSTSSLAQETLSQLIVQNKTIQIILDESNINYPTFTPKL